MTTMTILSPQAVAAVFLGAIALLITSGLVAKLILALLHDTSESDADEVNP